MRLSGSRARLAPRAAASLVVFMALGGQARAECDLGILARAHDAASGILAPSVLRGPVSVIVELPSGARSPEGFIHIAEGLGVLELDAVGLRTLSVERPEL